MYDVTLDEFTTTAKEDRARYNAICSWHLQAFSTAGIPLPYKPNATTVNVDYSTPNYEDNKRPAPTDDDPDNWEYDWSTTPDNDKILALLKKVVKFARSQHYAVEKDYDYDFSVMVTIPESSASRENSSWHPEITISYNCDREAVCTKVVTGTKVVPAYTSPERIEEIVEWDCNKIAFTS